MLRGCQIILSERYFLHMEGNSSIRPKLAVHWIQLNRIDVICMRDVLTLNLLPFFYETKISKMKLILCYDLIKYKALFLHKYKNTHQVPTVLTRMSSL